MGPEQHGVSGPHRRPGTHDHPGAEGAQGVLPVALLHDALVEAAPVDDHVGVEFLEHHQLELWVPLLLMVGEGVGLEDDVAEVRGHEERVRAVVHRPQLVEVVAEDTGWHPLLWVGDRTVVRGMLVMRGGGEMVIFSFGCCYVSGW